MNTRPRILLVFVLLVLQPFLWVYVGQRSRQLHNRQTNEQQFALLSQTVIASQQAFSQAQSRVLQLSQSFPSSNTISQVVGRMESFADAHKVAITLTSIEDGPSITVGSSVITSKRITAQFTGPVDSLFSSLEALEYQQEAARVESLDVVRANSASPSPMVFQMTVRILYYFYDVQ